MFSSDRTTLRRFYHTAWNKRRMGLPMEPLEAQVALVIEHHPEYQPLIEASPEGSEREYLPEMGETNPYLHMGLHIAIQEQVQTDRPAGIAALYRRAQLRFGGAHEAEHRLMECLGEMIWRSQRSGQPPDEQAYLECVKGRM